ncbi:MAG: hypothetical protein OXT72_10440 [Gammaproteobacteria bacterium]|nr:hypothetical protein [Gammaproteobacteria bacterium]MDE0246925.1 hypothetical protein [Gammaproteobacteria bacterium]
MDIFKLWIRPGLTSWWGEVRVSVDKRGRWTVHEPEGDAADLVRAYLNTHYGRDRLEQAPIARLVHEVLSDLDGEVVS